MAEIDPSIILGAKTDYGSTIDTAAKAMTLKHLMKQDAMNEKLMPLQQEAAQLDLDAKKTAMDEQEAIKSVFQNSYDQTTNRFDKMKAASGLYKVSPKFAQEWMTTQAKADQAFAKQLQDTHKNFVGVAGPLSKRAVDEYDKRVAAGMPEEIAWQQVQPMVASSMSMLESSGYGPEFTGGDASKLDIDTLRGVASQWDGSLKLDQERATAEATAGYRDRMAGASERRAAAAEASANKPESGAFGPPVKAEDAEGNPVYIQTSKSGEVRPVEGFAPPKAKATQMGAKEQATARNKIEMAKTLLRQLKAARAKFAEAKDSTLATGIVGGRNPLSKSGQAFDATLDALRGTVTAATRVPGIGSMSDWEGRMDQAKMPDRSQYDDTTIQKLDELKQLGLGMVKGYSDMLGEDMPDLSEYEDGDSGGGIPAGAPVATNPKTGERVYFDAQAKAWKQAPQ